MKAILKKLTQKKVLIPLLAGLLCLLLLLNWVYGWTAGDALNALDFQADEVEAIHFSSASWFLPPASITDPADIQAVIDEINGFTPSGNDLKQPKYYLPLGWGGSVRYDLQIDFKNGEQLDLCFSNFERGGFEPEEEREMTFCRSDRQVTPTPTCRGSVELFFALHEKYSSN